MNTQRFTPELKAEAVRQVIERGYSVAEIAARLGVSTHTLYKWLHQHRVPANAGAISDQAEHEPPWKLLE